MNDHEMICEMIKNAPNVLIINDRIDCLEVMVIAYGVKNEIKVNVKEWGF